MSYNGKTVEPGSRWSGSNFEKFQVINVTEIDNHTWVHYRNCKSNPDECREYSCYIESFLERFRKIVNE